MLPKRRFWKDEQNVNCAFRGTFQGCDFLIWATKHWKASRKLCLPNEDFRWLNEPFDESFRHAFQEPETRFGRLVIVKCFEKTHRTVRSAIENLRLGSIKNSHFIFCSSFQNLRLGGINVRSISQIHNAHSVVACCTDGFTKHIKHAMYVMCWFFWDAMFFCNNFMLPKRRFLKAEQSFGNVFSKHFSNGRRQNLVLTPLKRTSKRRSEMFVRSSKIFVWGT